MARWPNIGSAGVDLAFFILALATGLFGLPPFFAVIVVVAAIAAWGWTRRRPLMKLAPTQRYLQGAIAITMIAVVLALAYWIGHLSVGRHL